MSGLIRWMRNFGWLTAIFFACAATAQPLADPSAGPNPAAQAVADLFREAAKADIAFVAAGSLKAAPAGDLASMLQFPSDDLVVLKLTGKEVRDALERSVANYPEPNSAFLQVSGLVVTFSASGPPGSRIGDVRVGDNPLAPGRDYQVAMPASLARGALGYFKIWDKSKIVRNTSSSVESVLKGKNGAVSAPRYIVRP